MPHRTVNVTEFKAKCLALLQEVGECGDTITITKRGRPLAKVGPVHQAPWKSPEGAWIGRLTLPDGLLDADTSELWEVLRPHPEVRG
jgi:prevent-host-death family protein